jgi:hypothetical protein
MIHEEDVCRCWQPLCQISQALIESVPVVPEVIRKSEDTRQATQEGFGRAESQVRDEDAVSELTAGLLGLVRLRKVNAFPRDATEQAYDD